MNAELPLRNRLTISRNLLEFVRYPVRARLAPRIDRDDLFDEDGNLISSSTHLHACPLCGGIGRHIFNLVSRPCRSLLVSASRVRQRVQRLSYCNAFNFYKPNGIPYPPVFVTLTQSKAVFNLQSANREFSKFIMRFNERLRTGEQLAYIAAPEFHPGGHGIHYHAIFFNLPYIHHARDFIRELWPFGFQVRVSAVNDFVSCGRYLTKYITKQAQDGRFFRKRRFFPSRQLKLPMKFDDEKMIIDIMSRIEGVVEHHEFEGEYFRYERYLLHRPIGLLDSELASAHH